MGFFEKLRRRRVLEGAEQEFRIYLFTLESLFDQLYCGDSRYGISPIRDSKSNMEYAAERLDLSVIQKTYMQTLMKEIENLPTAAERAKTFAFEFFFILHHEYPHNDFVRSELRHRFMQIIDDKFKYEWSN